MLKARDIVVYKDKGYVVKCSSRFCSLIVSGTEPPLIVSNHVLKKIGRSTEPLTYNGYRKQGVEFVDQFFVPLSKRARNDLQDIVTVYAEYSYERSKACGGDSSKIEQNTPSLEESLLTEFPKEQDSSEIT